MNILSLRDIRFAFPGWPPTVEGANLEVEEGAFHCLVGRSGCGKTTLLKLAAGLLAPDAGRIDFHTRHPDAPGRDIGFVFQSPNLLEWRSVLDNVLLPVALHRRPTTQERQRAVDLLAQLGLTAHVGKVPGQLSGGQQSRVALARALVLQPSLLLLDEPFAALDAITREELQRDLLRMRQEAGTTVLFVTHDITEAVYLADQVDVVEGGRIAQQIPIALPSRSMGVRYTPEFGRYCAQVRDALHLEPVAA